MRKIDQLLIVTLNILLLTLIINYSTNLDTKVDGYFVKNQNSTIVSEVKGQQDSLVIENDNVEVTAKTKTPETLQKKDIGVVVTDYQNQAGSISQLENQLNTNFSTVSIYLQFGNQHNNSISNKNLSYIKNQEKTLLIAWEPWNPDQGLNQSEDFLSDIISGQQDGYIRQFANEIKSYSGKVTIRFGHEMNGNWYPWGNRPEEYVTAYKRIVDIFRSVGVSNVAWMWCINSDSVPNEPISLTAKYYPGDSYVDVIGVDGFNYGNTQKWRSFDDIFGVAYSYLANKYSQTLVIAETASSEIGGNKAEWIDDMFATLDRYPRVNEIIWFNLIKEADWRIDSTDSSFNSFKNGV